MTSTTAKQTLQQATPRASANQRALVVGVSGYPASIGKLPAVAADVRAMAALLSSKSGIFSSTGVVTLTERKAVKADVLSALRKTFTGAKSADTVFVYLAGHGAVEGTEYYFVPYDAKPGRFSETGVPLSEIKQMFDRTASRRVFLWLDFCHSGGILSRGTRSNDLAEIRRSIGVVSGHGKIIVAACTSAQLAYEDPTIGHGLFTHALLRGLRGEAKSAQGEVTASSLYDFIDHQLKDPRQRPIFFGEMTGRIVLMHYADRTAVSAVKRPEPAKPTSSTKSPSTSSVSTSGNLLLLDGQVYVARTFNEKPDGSIDVQIVPKTLEEEAALRSLRGDRFARSKNVSFAFQNLSFNGQVGEVSSQTIAGKSTWSVTMTPADASSNYMLDSGYNGISAEGLADMRVRLLLLGEKPEARGTVSDSTLLHFIQGPLKERAVDEAVFASLWKKHSTPPADFLRQARLWALYYLKVSGICDDVLELKLGPVRAGKMAVKFRGRRRSRYSNGEPHEIVVSGTCMLK
jgi:hypothetical protein